MSLTILGWDKGALPERLPGQLSGGPYSPSLVPDLELYDFQSLPENPDNLPEDLDIPTRIFNQTEVVGRAVTRFTLEIPEEVLDPVPLWIVHGWYGVEPVYEPWRNWSARNGKPTGTINSVSKLSRMAAYHPNHYLNPGKLLSQAAYGALRGSRKINDLERLGVDGSQGDLAGHSLGGRTAVSAALHANNPEQQKHDHVGVRSVTLVAAAGTEPHSVPEFLVNRIPDLLTNELPKAYRDGKLRRYGNISLLEELAYYVAREFGLRALREGISIGNDNICTSVSRLGALGIRTAMMGYQADAMVPAVKSLRHSGHRVDVPSIFPYENVGHLGPITYPEATGLAIFELLDELNGTNLARRGKFNKQPREIPKRASI